MQELKNCSYFYCSSYLKILQASSQSEGNKRFGKKVNAQNALATEMTIVNLFFSVKIRQQKNAE